MREQLSIELNWSIMVEEEEEASAHDFLQRSPAKFELSLFNSFGSFSLIPTVIRVILFFSSRINVHYFQFPIEHVILSK